MLFKKIFVENEVKNTPQTQFILNNLKATKTHPIESINDVFGRVKKPYLQKRDHLNLFIGKKRGQLVKLAPEAYGVKGEPHYYFIHAYNCIYECEYCYLQGYFNSPDIVLFTNYDDIAKTIKSTCHLHKDKKVWFHAGEFSDSLALSHITGECDFYFNTFKELPNAYLELRTKSANIKSITKQEPLPNVIISFSLSPKKNLKTFDHKTATYKQRMQAIKTLIQLGHSVALHFDPIIHTEDYLAEYQELIEDLTQNIDLRKIKYISLGVVRFTKDVFRELSRNYPESQMITSEFKKSFDNKVRYPRPLRLHIMNNIKKVLQHHGVDEKNIYLCME